MAAPAEECHRDWVRILQDAFALCQVAERRALEQIIVQVKPDVLVVDMALPGLSRVHGFRAIQRLSPATKIIGFTDAYAEDEGLAALKIGAKGYCARPTDAADLAKVVGAVLNGEIWASRKLVRGLVAELVSLLDSEEKSGRRVKPDPRLEHLTERQRLVADLISRGSTNKEIGGRLNISERTVKAHLTEAFRNVGVSDRLQLALLFRGHSSVLGDD
jgi:two-component system NarL family response regulator